MSVHCLICNQEFKKLITSTHLKKHNILTAEYVQKFGKESLSSAEYRKEKSLKNSGTNNPNYGNKMSSESKNIISSKNSGKTAWNKDLTFEDTTKQKEVAKIREEKYKNGTLVRITKTHTDETKNKISNSVKDYARLNKDELSTRAYKALDTKLKNGINLGFFKDRKHSAESKEKISIKSKEYSRIKTEQSISDMKDRLNNLGFSVIHYNEHSLTAKCNICSNEISYTKQMFQPSKIREDLCFVCHPPLVNRSKLENSVYEFVSTFVDCVQTYRFDETKRTLDIFVPSRNIAIEVHGLYWHSAQLLESIGYSKTKDFEKLKDVNNKGIRLIQIFEDEWINNGDIVKSRLKHILGADFNKTIYARNCEIKEISSNESSIFCNKYHLQGNGRSNVRLGLFNGTELISVMTFSKNNISRKINGWELNRFCSANFNIPGAASKLFSYFVKKYSPESVITYADRRWSDGNLYSKMGFTFEKYTVPNYWYLKDNLVRRIHRFSLRKTKDDPVDITEKELREEQGYKIIYDSGNSKWVWSK